MLKYGIKRHIDLHGRIVIPKELRKSYQITEKDALEIIGTNEGILIKVPDVEIIRKG